MAKITLNVSDDFKRSLHERARETGIPIRELVRQSVEVNMRLRSYGHDAKVVIHHQGVEETIVII